MLKRWEVRVQPPGAEPRSYRFLTHRKARETYWLARHDQAWTLSPTLNVTVHIIKHPIDPRVRFVVGLVFIAAVVALTFALPQRWWLGVVVGLAALWPWGILIKWVETGRWAWKWWR